MNEEDLGFFHGSVALGPWDAFATYGVFAADDRFSQLLRFVVEGYPMI